MHFTRMDAYYHLTTLGDHEAYQILYSEFLNKARNLIRLIGKSCSNFTVNPGDFSQFIDSLFFRAINEFNPLKGTFSSYVEFIFSYRLTDYVRNKLIQEANTFAPIENSFGEACSIELIPDPNQPSITTELIKNNFTYKIASKRNNKTFVERITDKILLLQYAGYKDSEICRALKISVAKLRKYKKLIENNDEIVNLKLDLK